MLIASYNKEQLGDVLLVVVADDQGTQAFEKKENIVRIFDEETNQTKGYNFFDAAAILGELDVLGQVFLDDAQVEKLNAALTKAGFEAELVNDHEPKFVVGHVDELEDHPDSDHLHVTKVTIDGQKQLQIVCGAPNIEAGQNVVVAKVGAMMPDGSLIFAGKLRGIDSFGMLCSARELALPNAPQKRGILVLDPEEYPCGQAFDFQKAQNLFQA